MEVTFSSAVVFVEDMPVSRKFYEELLGQEVLMDHGQNVVYVGGLSIWQVEHALRIVYGRDAEPADRLGRDNLELYFETEDLDAAWSRISGSGAGVIREVHEEPWGQRVFRFYDPNGHIVEIGEPMPAVVSRLLAEGLDPEKVSERTSMPLGMVKEIAGEGGS